MRDASLKKFLLGHTEDDTLIKPVFYNQIDTAGLTKLIAEDSLFRIEGLERGVNYTRI
jgi:hypothetical protein